MSEGIFLKKIELFGFKSFADRCEVSFEPGVTAIIGPNGCGKSNIADALKWVLGENSAKELRGSKMEDVIFNGTFNRPAINIAEVVLTFSNNPRRFPVEYDEVTVSRRIYRSGESEYFLNKTKVRLKDVLDILMDTGLGTPSYSFIAQGKIDRILSSKPEDRRSVFEEASGIMKYKTKKKEAVNKLTLTQENLLRVNDVIVELKRQMDSIRRQANKARNYKQIYDELKNSDLKVSKYKYLALVSNTEKANVEKVDAEKNQELLNSQLTECESEFAQKKILLEELDAKINDIQSEVLRVGHTIDSNLELANVHNERIKDYTQRLDLIKNEVSLIENKLVSLSKNIEDSIAQIESTAQTKDSQVRVLVDKDNLFGDISGAISIVQTDIINNQKAKDSINTELNSLINKQTEYTVKVGSLEHRQKQLAGDCELLSKELSGFTEKINAIDENIKNIPMQVQQLGFKKNDLVSVLMDSKKERDEVSAKLMEYREDLTVKRSRYKFLEDIVENYEGFSNGIKNLIKSIELGDVPFKPVKGILADLIDVEDKNTKAIEASIGEDIQTIIVESKDEAKKIIDYMNKNDLGRIRIFCLDMLFNTNVERKFKHDGIVGSAFDLVNVKPEHADIVKFFIKDKIVSKNFDFAQQILLEYPELDSVVTLEGEIVHRNGIIVGGGFVREDDAGLLGRRSKLNKYKYDINNLETEIIKAEASLRHKEQQLNLIESDISVFEEEIRAKNFKFDSEVRVREEIQQSIDRHICKKQLLENELDSVNFEMKNFLDQISNFDVEIVDKKSQIDNLVQLQMESEKELASLLARKESISLERTHIKTELSLIDAKLNEKQQFIEQCEQQHSESRQILVSKQKEHTDCIDRVENLKIEITNLENKNQQLQEKKVAVESEYIKLGDQRAELATKFVEADHRKKNILKQIQFFKDSVRDIQLRQTQIEYDIKSITEHVKEKYNQDIFDFDPKFDECFNVERETELLNELKEKLEQLGPVNLVAIEEEEEAKNRYEFLNTQKQDLDNAREDLIKAINKINATIKDIFRESFDKIRVAFTEYFKILFNGGEADIFLLDENDILESGIEVVVRPPGKKLQSISLLSGGERALTAVAILFAVFKVKPSPFCVLDEIDAPLDEPNVDRFTKLLKEFVKESQFIIITHNKKTIAVSDVMYGITMQDVGVSKIISAKFTKTESLKV